MLSPLQERVASIVARLPEARDFALAGGAALIVRGDVDRHTRDLDFFTTDPQQVERLVPVLEAALRNENLTVERRQVGAGFARLSVSAGRDRTEVDLAADARLLPPEPSPYGPVLRAEELAADKVLAVFGRAQARDFVDLSALEPRYGLERLCRLAAEKDRGFRPAVLREMLERFDRLPRADFDLDDAAFARLRNTVSRWHDQLGVSSELPRWPTRDDGIDLGL